MPVNCVHLFAQLIVPYPKGANSCFVNVLNINPAALFQSTGFVSSLNRIGFAADTLYITIYN